MSFSAFTSSMNTREDLEAIFTARDREARIVLSGIRDAVDTGNLHNVLLTGPRGIGKTHMVSLTYYRVKDDQHLSDNLRIAWVSEDPYRAASYTGLLNEILDRLSVEYAMPDWPARRRAIQDQVEGRQKKQVDAIKREIESLLEDEIKSVLDGRVLLILSENVDEVLKGLGDTGQKRLRAFLQADIKATLVCTATSITPELSKRESPFHGFFRTIELKPFTFQDCLTVLTKMAHRRGNDDVADLLQSTAGRGRVRAIQHIAGGNPRVYVIFYEFLSKDLEDIRRPFMELVDHLLPYYQGRMQALSPAQRHYIDIIRRNEGPLAVRDIAREALTSSQSVSSDLRDLAEKGYLISNRAGRESLYELREPLMRICLAAKEQRGEGIPLFIEFLRIWFTQDELDQATEGSLGRDYQRYEAEIEEARRRHAAMVAFQTKLIHEAERDGKESEAVLRLQRLCDMAPDNNFAWWQLRRKLEDLGRIDELIALLEERVSLRPASASDWNQLGVIYFNNSMFDKSLRAHTKSIEVSKKEGIHLENYIRSLEACNRTREVEKFSRTLLETRDFGHSYGDQSLKGTIHTILGAADSAIASYVEAIKVRETSTHPWVSICNILDNAGAYQSLLSWTELAVEQESLQNGLMPWRRGAYYCTGRLEDALVLIDRGIEEEGSTSNLLSDRFSVLVALGRIAEARKLLQSHKDEILNDNERSAIAWHGVLEVVDGNITLAESQIDRAIELETSSDGFRSPRAGIDVVNLTHDERIWARLAEFELKAFDHYNALSHLGVALVRGVLHPASRVPTDRLSAWVDIWRDRAMEHEALVIPVRLMAVAARVRETKDRRPLMDLTVEQRDLLAPHVDRYLRFVGVEAHPLDGVVETAIKDLRAHFARKKRHRVRPTAIPSMVTDQEVAAAPSDERLTALLDTYAARRRVEDALSPLTEHKPSPLPKREARQVLSKMWEADPQLAVILAEPSISVRRIDVRPALGGSVHQIHLDTPRGTGALDVIEFADAGGNAQFLLIDGTNTPLRRMVEEGFVDLAVVGDQAYITFFCKALRGEESRFEVLSHEDRSIRKILKDSGTDPATLEFGPKDVEGTTRYRWLLVYGGHLFQATLVRAAELAWGVEMIDDLALTEVPPDWPRERFDGPIRHWASAEEAVSPEDT